MLWVWIPCRRGVLDTTLCDKVCQWLATGQWFSSVTLVSSTNKIDRHDTIEILLKMALNTITHKIYWYFTAFFFVIHNVVLLYSFYNKERQCIYWQNLQRLRTITTQVLFYKKNPLFLLENTPWSPPPFFSLVNLGLSTACMSCLS